MNEPRTITPRAQEILAHATAILRSEGFELSHIVNIANAKHLVDNNEIWKDQAAWEFDGDVKDLILNAWDFIAD